MTKYKVVILDSAFEDLESIHFFCKNTYNEQYSSKVIKFLIKEILSLDIFPLLNPVYYISNHFILRKKIVYKRYLIIFTVINDTVFIYNIIDGRRNIKPKDLFKIPIFLLSNFLTYSNYLSTK